MRILLFVLGGYLLGSFPTGVILSRRKFKIDVREMGSGNIGATNITRVFGWGAGATTLTIDFLKGFAPLALLRHYAPDWHWELSALGLSLVLGHCYSLYLGFKGGKGVATSLGCLIVVAPVLALACIPVYSVLLIVSKISAVGSLGCVFLSLLYPVLFKPDFPQLVLILGINLIVLVRHISNIQRLVRTVKGEK